MVPPINRLNGAHGASKVLSIMGRWQESSFLLSDTIKMLQKVSPRFLERDDQEYALSNRFPTGLVADAISLALGVGTEASECLGLLELGRGIIMGLVIDCRSDLSELQTKYPDAFSKFNDLRAIIDAPSTYIEGHASHESIDLFEHKRRQRISACNEIEESLADIRQLPGFEGFQLPPSPGELMVIAKEGPIVVLNSTEYRSDAILVTGSAIKAIPLPNLDYTTLISSVERIPKLIRGRQSQYPSRNDELAQLLLWLWDVAVEPIFEKLGLVTAINETRFGGPLSKLPFHAAGDHSPGSTRNTLSRAISSYIPKIKALSYARQKKLELLSRPDSRLLLVSMPTTPGKTSLNVTQEIEEIIGLAKGRTIPTELDRPSTAKVLAEIPSYNAVHFACHGVSNSQRPSDNYLLLRKDDGTLDRLTVGAISNITIKHAQIAYLSACSTAQNSATKLVDKSIHIASGFQLAGFSHVLATQWVSMDTACRQVSKEFYRLLFQDHPSGSDEGHEKVSTAFHHAVKKLRDDGHNRKQPLKWAGFIHTGA